MKYIHSFELESTINEILREHNIELTLEPHDLEVDSFNKTIKWNIQDINKPKREDKISSYLKENTFKPIDVSSRVFYHYLPEINYLERIEEGYIRLYSLNKYLKGKGDKSEYRLFLDNFGISFPDEQIHALKDDIFIWCLTTTNKSEKHWKEYAKNGKGIVLEIQFKSMTPLQNIIEFSDVCYNLDFLEEIQNTLKEKYGLQLEIFGFLLFAKYFKQKCFSWENEIRLSLDNNARNLNNGLEGLFNLEDSQKANIDHLFSVEVDEQRGEKYIELPIKNKIFEMEIIRVYNQEQAFAE